MSRFFRVHFFTLIELLTVIAIIAVLAAMLLPTLSRARSKATDSACLNLLKQYGVATAIYSMSWDGYLPDVQTYLLPESGFAEAFAASAGGSMPEKITRCPADGSTASLGRLGETSINGKTLQLSYGGSGNTLSNSLSGRKINGVFVTVPDFVKVADSRIKQPAKSFIWCDYQARSSDSHVGFYPAVPPGNSDSLGNIAFRHARCCNAVYLDGHTGFARMNNNIVLCDNGHNLAPGYTWARPSNTQYPFGPRAANVAKGVSDNPSVTYQ